MARRYRPHDDPSDWTSLLTKDPQCPIPSAWVVELSRTFVGDLTDAVPRTGMIINSAYGLSWDPDVVMFERFKVPIWVYWASNMVHHRAWKNYLPSATDIAAARNRKDQWGVQSDENPWGVKNDDNPWGVENDDNPSHGNSWGNDPWGTPSNDPAPAPIIQSQPDLSHFPLPKKNSGQKHGEDFKAFFARRAMRNKEKEEKETPSQRQARLGRERSAMNHHIPGKSSTTQVFEWRPEDDDEEDGFLLRHPVTKACVEGIWGDYSKDTRVFDAFSNQWDLCRALNPTSIPDGDDREDNDDIMPPFPITAPSVLPPPTPSSFSRDIYKYFGNEVSLASRHASIEGLLPILHYHFGYRPMAAILPPLSGSIRLEQWTKKMQWEHTRKLVGDSTAETGSIAEPQRRSITNFIALLVNSKQCDLDSSIPPDVWDLGPNPSLQISHAYIQVSYAELSQRRFFIIEPRQFPNHVIWTLAIPDPIIAVMCLRRNWGSDLKEIALALLQRGMAFRTLQRMAVVPNLRRPLTELRTYTLGHRQSPFRAIYADYVVYEQLRHEFMNRPRARAAFLHGGLIWRLALHSLGFDYLPSVLDGISPEAVPFGLLLCSNDQTYYDDELSEEEIDFMCGTYYMHQGKLSLTDRSIIAVLIVALSSSGHSILVASTACLECIRLECWFLVFSLRRLVPNPAWQHSGRSFSRATFVDQ